MCLLGGARFFFYFWIIKIYCILNINKHILGSMYKHQLFGRKYFFLILLVSFLACNSNQEKINIKEIKLERSFLRFDQDLFRSDLDTLDDHILFLNQKYPDFLPLFSYQIANIGSPNSKMFEQLLQRFITDYTVNLAKKKVNESFPDLKPFEKHLTDGLKRFSWYFPDKKIPALYTFIGGFNQSIVVADSILAVGLDKYLGRDEPAYKRLGIYRYRVKNMYSRKIPADAMHSWIKTEFPFQDSTDNLVSHMIYNGKLLYLTDLCLPEMADTIKLGFTKDELEFCLNNEENMWTYLIENELLFKTDQNLIIKLTQDGPFTKPFTNESPGRAVNWMGWQIVKEYMKNADSASVRGLMNTTDEREILRLSRYDP